MRKFLLTAAALTVAVPALTMALAVPASAAPKAHSTSISANFAACGRVGPNLENRFVADAPLGGAANQRSGSSTSCPRPGILQPTHDAIYYCYTVAPDGTWTYLLNVATGVHGWVRDDLLDFNGSFAYCGF